jgi:3-dehydroshikimate dehydratase
MIKTGLTSVTFRGLSPEQIIALVVQAGLQGIEWGGDIHVPHGNLERAVEVGHATRAAGLEVSSYGSYYRVGCEDNSVTFERVLETSLRLGAPTIRVWAGDHGSFDTDPNGWKRVLVDAERIGLLAEQAGIRLAFEYHEDTLTDTSSSACRLMREIGRKNFGCYWQPPIFAGFEERIKSLKDISPWLSYVHAFHHDSHQLLPFRLGESEWRAYLPVISAHPGDRYCLIEFVAEETGEQFLEDARFLKNICSRSLSKITGLYI